MEITCSSQSFAASFRKNYKISNFAATRKTTGLEQAGYHPFCHLMSNSTAPDNICCPPACTTPHQNLQLAEGLKDIAIRCLHDDAYHLRPGPKTSPQFS